MNKEIIISLLILLFLLIFSFNSSNDEAFNILKKADQVLIPQIAKFKFKLIVKKENEEPKETIYDCFKKYDDRYLFFVISPKTIYGQATLRIKETIWTYYPLADQMTKIDYKTGVLDSGLDYVDVMYSELTNYYDARIVDNNYIYKENNWNKYGENIKEYPVCFKLELKVKKGRPGYPTAIVYIEKNTYLTLKREYYSLSNEKVKEIYYYSYIFKNKDIKNFTMEVYDLFNIKILTIAQYYNIEVLKNIPDQYFTQNFIKTYLPEQ